MNLIVTNGLQLIWHSDKWVATYLSLGKVYLPISRLSAKTISLTLANWHSSLSTCNLTLETSPHCGPVIIVGTVLLLQLAFSLTVLGKLTRIRRMHWLSREYTLIWILMLVNEGILMLVNKETESTNYPFNNNDKGRTTLRVKRGAH